MRVRKISSYGKAVGRFSSFKMKDLIHWESSLERDYFFILEFDQQVIEYYEQPLKIEYIFENKKRTYTPDILVKRADRT